MTGCCLNYTQKTEREYSMNMLIDLIKNPVFLSAGGAWLVAQGAKNICEAIRYGFSKERLAGGGGMPSAHSATVTGLTVGCLLSDSAASPEFVVALFLAIVVMYDAMGVRLETGQQAKILNKMRERDIAEGREPLFEKPMDEHMGHTLPEVIVGVLTGIVVAVIMCTWIAPLIGSVL